MWWVVSITEDGQADKFDVLVLAVVLLTWCTERINMPLFFRLCFSLVISLNSVTSNNGHCRGISVLSVIGGVR